MRCADGVCVGLIFNGLSKLDKSRTWSYIVSAMCAPALNTLFFMGYIVLAFYNCDYVQNLVSVKGAANPLMFVVLLVGSRAWLSSSSPASWAASCSRRAQVPEVRPRVPRQGRAYGFVTL